MIIAAALLLVFTFFTPNTPTFAEVHTQVERVSSKDNSATIQSVLKEASAYILLEGVDSEWEAIGLARAGAQVPSNYNEKFLEHLQDQVISQSGKGRMKITDVERLAMAAVAIGKNPTNIDGKGFNLIEKIYNSEPWTTGADSLTFQGNNGIIFALIALDSKGFEIPNHAKWTREKLVAELLKYQKDDGSWSLSSSTTGATSFDITAMALTALAPYGNQASTKQAIDKAVRFLSEAQDSEGGFNEAFVGGISSEATSQVIIGLTANGIDPRSEQFTKQEVNLIDHLLSFQSEDGGFKHTSEDRSSNGMATEQALQALVAVDLYMKGEGSLYDFTGQIITPNPIEFTDVKGTWAEEFIGQAVQLGIVKGYPDGSFKPNNQLTRAQSVSILVRALDLKTSESAPFNDIGGYAAETQAEIAAAYKYGLIVNPNGKFNPSNKVTRAQMALMLHRAYTFKTGTNYTAEKQAPYSDFGNYDAETVNAISMLYELGIATGSNGKYNPSNPTTRAHAAKMLVNYFEELKE